MNKQSYDTIFNKTIQENEGVFIPFIVAGDPNYDTSLRIAKTLVDNGADALEIGFPFSDPVADGPSVQNADLRAFKGGMTVEKCFKFLKELREYTDKPFGLLLYYNLVYKYGINDFYRKLSEVGVNAVLIADLPPEEAEDAINAANTNGLEQIFIVSQATSNDRLKEITKIVGGFIYIASVMGTTGARKEVEHNTTELIKRIREHTRIPLCVGFGISEPEHVHKVLDAGADGAIVGSALINIIEEYLDNETVMIREISDYMKKMKEATRGN
ncbi:tryptophan synthase subunit alpha [Methanosphaera sp. ISO3-F5]|uniref:tryptophan synthase subunit alpha n=1 Tax=Methanosphaera sp. ISO3-F5 TaxID=1452353 RepID=UPI002B257C67|nr:tryptophan synthase subunit alpha [Methanosphaera sp. ISO3-F5]WQH64639.1 tryptophan synthase subunit alpha [Methanosphaera sp. ISO3-F5]